MINCWCSKIWFRRRYLNTYVVISIWGWVNNTIQRLKTQHQQRSGEWMFVPRNKCYRYNSHVVGTHFFLVVPTGSPYSQVEGQSKMGPRVGTRPANSVTKDVATLQEASMASSEMPYKQVSQWEHSL